MFTLEPFLPLENLDIDARGYAERITCKQGKTKGRVKTSRPKDDTDYYVWRMVRFYASPDPKASCLPIAAGFAVDKTRFEHTPPCGRSTKSYPSIDVAYTRNVGMFNSEGNYRMECTCGTEEKQQAENIRYKAEMARLDGIVGRILAVIPAKEQYGMRRWGRAFTGSDPYATGDILDPVNMAVTNKKDELEGSMM